MGLHSDRYGLDVARILGFPLRPLGCKEETKRLDEHGHQRGSEALGVECNVGLEMSEE